MKHDETRNFLDCVASGEARVKYHGIAYFCNGVTVDQSGMCRIEVFPDDIGLGEQDWRSRWWHYEGKSTEECMEAFLNVKYWDGKTFYEAVPEMEWID